MENGLNNKVAIYWIVGIVVVIALVLGFFYSGNKSKIENVNLENVATTTEDINSNNENPVVRPANNSTTTPKAPVKNTAPVNNFDYKG